MARSRTRLLVLMLLSVSCLRATCQLAFEEAGISDPEDVRWDPLGLDDYQDQQQQQSQYMDASNMLMDYMNQPDEVYSDTQATFPTYDNGMAFEEMNFDQAPDHEYNDYSDNDYAQERQYHQEMNYHRSHGLGQYPISSSSGVSGTPSAFEETNQLVAPMQSASVPSADNAQPADPELSAASMEGFDAADSYMSGTAAYPDNTDYGGFSGDDADGGDPEFWSQDYDPEFARVYHMESAQISSSSGGGGGREATDDEQQRAHFDTLFSQMAAPKAPAGVETASVAATSALSQEASENSPTASLAAAATAAEAPSSSSAAPPSSSSSIANIVYTGDGRAIDLTAHSQALALEPQQQQAAAAPAPAQPAATVATPIATSEAQLQVIPASTNSGSGSVAFEEVNVMAEDSGSTAQYEAGETAAELISTDTDDGSAGEAVEDSSNNNNESMSSNVTADKQEKRDDNPHTTKLIPTSTWKPYQQAMYEAGQAARPDKIEKLEESATGLITARRASSSSSSSATPSPGLSIAGTAGIVAGSVAAAALVGYVIVTARTHYMQNNRSVHHEGSGHISKGGTYPDIECAQSYVSHSNPSSPATSRKSRLAEATYASAESYSLDVMNVSPTRSPGRTTQLPFSKLHKGH